MSWIAWTWLIVLVLAVYGLLRLGKPRSISEEEFEREARRPSLVRTGLQEFQGFLEPEKRAALEAVQAEERKTDQTVPGEPPENDRAIGERSKPGWSG
jgi:hypothetical protein